MADYKNTDLEFDVQCEENQSAAEFCDVALEEIVVTEQMMAEEREFEEVAEQGVQSASSKQSTTTQTTSKIAAGAVAVAGVAILAMTVISGSASFSKFDIYGTSVDFQLETTIEYSLEDEGVVDYENFDTNLRMITYQDYGDNSNMILLSTGNEELACEVEVTKVNSDGSEVNITFDGKIQGLLEGTSYTTQIVGEDENGGLKVYLTKKFTTTGAQTFLSDIEWECRCTVDGNFYFKVNYIDDSGYYSNFKYKLISQTTGEIYAQGDMINPQETQSVYVADAPGMDYVLEITFDSAVPSDVSAGESEKVYRLDVKI